MNEVQEIRRALCAVARPRLNPAACRRLARFAQRPVSWGRVVEMARQERMAGLLCHHLSAAGLMALLPEGPRHTLEGFYHDQIVVNLCMLDAARRIEAGLDRAGLAGMAIQGLTVLRRWGAPGLRPADDIDLMVHPADLAAVRSLLIGDGFLPMAGQEKLLVGRGVVVDLHVHPLELARVPSRRFLFPADVEALWTGARPLFGQGRLLCPDPVNNIVLLAAHALKHGYDRLIWLADIRLLVDDLDAGGGWDRLSESAVRWRQERTVLYALLLVEALWGRAAPQDVKRALGLGRLGATERWLLHAAASGLVADWLCFALWLCQLEGLGPRLRLVAESMFPGGDSPVRGLLPARSAGGRVSALSRAGFLLAQPAAAVIGFLRWRRRRRVSAGNWPSLAAFRRR